MYPLSFSWTCSLSPLPSFSADGLTHSSICKHACTSFLSSLLSWWKSGFSFCLSWIHPTMLRIPTFHFSQESWPISLFFPLTPSYQIEMGHACPILIRSPYWFESPSSFYTPPFTIKGLELYCAFTLQLPLFPLISWKFLWDHMSKVDRGKGARGLFRNQCLCTVKGGGSQLWVWKAFRLWCGSERFSVNSTGSFRAKIAP